MHYQHYTSEDFALDERFQQWVLNPDEENTAFWNNWRLQYPEKQKEIAEAIELVRKTGLSEDPTANQAFLEVWGSLEENAQKNQKQRRMQATFRYTSMAAVWTVFILVATFLLWESVQFSGNTEYKTKFGQVKKIVLPDGSKVVLNGNSYLRFSEGSWTQNQPRQVYLEGEAFFEVVKTRDKRSFTVKTQEKVEVKVLGTEFNVKSRRKATFVYLQSGKVAFKATTNETSLKPGELATYHTQEKKVTILPAKKDKHVSWKNNLFVFDDTPLAEIAGEIEDTFGVKVKIAADSLANKRFTAKVPRHKPDILLKVLSETLQVDVLKEYNYITVQAKTTPAR